MEEEGGDKRRLGVNTTYSNSRFLPHHIFIEKRKHYSNYWNTTAKYFFIYKCQK